MNKLGNDDLNGSALELQPIMDNEALIHNRVRLYHLTWEIFEKKT